MSSSLNSSSALVKLIFPFAQGILLQILSRENFYIAHGPTVRKISYSIYLYFKLAIMQQTAQNSPFFGVEMDVNGSLLTTKELLINVYLGPLLLIVCDS